MRAPLNTTCTVYDGPGTATPGFPRIVAMPCRLVPDPYFTDTTLPLLSSTAYLTYDNDIVRGPVITDLGGGQYTFDFSRADRIIVDSLPAIVWVVVRVETCTWQRDEPIYFRASLAPDEPAPEACALTYLDCYSFKGHEDPTLGNVTKVDPYNWTDGTVTLLAESVGPVFPLCWGNWVLKLNDVTYEGIWNGIGTTTLVANDGSGWQVDLGPCV